MFFFFKFYLIERGIKKCIKEILKKNIQLNVSQRHIEKEHSKTYRKKILKNIENVSKIYLKENHPQMYQGKTYILKKHIQKS